MTVVTLRPIAWIAALAAVVLIPLAGMQFSAEVNWTPFDFAAAIALVILGGLALEAVLRWARAPATRWLAGMCVAVGFAAVWGALATA